MTLQEAVSDYVSTMEITKRPLTVVNAKFILQEFANLYPGYALDAIGRKEILAYLSMLKKKGLHEHTIAAKYGRIHALLSFHGVEVSKRDKRADRPRYTEPLPECYSEQELSRFFAACRDIRQIATFKTLLMCGLRKREHMWLTWSDLEDGCRMLHVQPHPPFFAPKTHEERRIPVPGALAELLRQMPRRTDWLVFPTKGGVANQHLLKECKTVARRASLDVSGFWLHKFRATYATTLLRRGIDLRTTMALLGHRDIESTMRYLRPLESEQLRGKVDDIFTRLAI